MRGAKHATGAPRVVASYVAPRAARHHQTRKTVQDARTPCDVAQADAPARSRVHAPATLPHVGHCATVDA